MWMRSCGKKLALPLCAMHGSVVMPRKTTCAGKSHSCGPVIPKQRSSKTLEADSTGSEKDLSPYWNAYTAEKSCALWLPTVTVLQGSALNLLNGWQSKTGARSWFSTSQVVVRNRNSERIFCPFSIRSLVGCMDLESIVTKSRKIRVYLTSRQKALVDLWMQGSRWWYNEAVSLYRAGFSVSEYDMRRIVRAVSPKRFDSVPSKILSGAIKDACMANKAVLRERKRLKKKGIKRKVVLNFRDRKCPRQSFSLCNVAWNKDLTTIYPRSLRQIRLSESVDAVKDGRFVSLHGRYYVTVPYSSPRRVAETQGRVVALDPGIRSFLTFYSENDCGKIGEGDFGRIQRLCVHLDSLIGRKTKAKGYRISRLGRAIKRLRCRIRDLIDELHKQVARWLVDNYDVILLPTFETSEMVIRGKRCLQRQSVRSMLTFAHYRFKTFLKHKAFEMGKRVLDVNEAYTSKTVSWTGEVVKNLGGAKVIRSRIDGRVMDRDINGARGIFLRALVDTPKLRNCLV